MSIPEKTSTVIRGRPFAWGARTYVMGILNVTPDSFSGDGLAGDVKAAAARAKAFENAGADILDIGGESTRPGAKPVAAEEEMQRILPVVQALTPATSLPLSIDTYKSPVAAAAVRAGVSIINDVWGLLHDARIGEVAAKRGSTLVVMHNQHGTQYEDFIPDVLQSLARSLELAYQAGVPREHIIIDPGFGFGKTPAQNLELLRRLEEFTMLGHPILIGTSRKSTIGLVLDLPVGERLEGTAATVAIAIAKGADIVRVHDVKAMARVAKMSDAIIRGWEAAE
jgi:dihydropteroate synthase